LLVNVLLSSRYQETHQPFCWTPEQKEGLQHRRKPNVPSEIIRIPFPPSETAEKVAMIEITTMSMICVSKPGSTPNRTFNPVAI